ncbi:MAG: O-methyltransferase [Bacilli bacterium]
MVDNILTEVQAIKQYAIANKIPIMVDEGIKFLTTFIVQNNINNVLEVGTAIGYSAIMMCLANPNLKIVSIERDEVRYLEAVKNIKKLNLENRITLIFKDAIDVIIDGKFDLVFLDAAKGKNIDFFEKFDKNIITGGYIITDNLGFHGLVDKDDAEIKSRNLRSLVKKIREFKLYLEENKYYNTTILNIGDKISLSEKK